MDAKSCFDLLMSQPKACIVMHSEFANNYPMTVELYVNPEDKGDFQVNMTQGSVQLYRKSVIKDTTDKSKEWPLISTETFIKRYDDYPIHIPTFNRMKIGDKVDED